MPAGPLEDENECIECMFISDETVVTSIPEHTIVNLHKSNVDDAIEDMGRSAQMHCVVHAAEVSALEVDL